MTADRDPATPPDTPDTPPGDPPGGAPPPPAPDDPTARPSLPIPPAPAGPPPPPTDGERAGGSLGAYLRFGAMIATGTALMLGLMYLNTYAWDHVRWSETRFYMALIMGATMALVMLAFMIGHYPRRRVNAGIMIAAVVVFAAALALVRSQATVQDGSYMRAMIPHHSIAILTSERADIADVRVCDLAVGIIEAQRREIDEMAWLLDDIAEHGAATTRAEAAQRPVPTFPGTADRSCPSAPAAAG